jgi:uncharacterized peroxidase-related enzyme
MMALASYRPDVYSRLGSLANVLLHQQHPSSTLSPGDRELIAAYVSSLNRCDYCHMIHGAVAAAHLQNPKLVEDVKCDYEASDASPKMKALLRIAGMVQKSGREVTGEAVESAKKEGATEMDVHDTVLIAAAFCMFAVLAENGYEGTPVRVGAMGKGEKNGVDEVV